MISPVWHMPTTFHPFTDRGPPWGCQIATIPRKRPFSSCLIWGRKTKAFTNVAQISRDPRRKTIGCFSTFWVSQINFFFSWNYNSYFSFYLFFAQVSIVFCLKPLIFVCHWHRSVRKILLWLMIIYTGRSWPLFQQSSTLMVHLANRQLHGYSWPFCRL